VGEWGEAAFVIALLVACLVALVLVLLARREAEATRRQAAEDAANLKAEARTMLADVQRREEHVAQRERDVAAERREARELTEQAEATAQQANLRAQQAEADRRAAREELAAARAEAAALLEVTSGLSPAEARAEQVKLIIEDAEREAAAAVRRAEARARRTAEERARHIVATAVHRMAGPTSTQSVVTVVPLPAEEMKGRIIGKEGRNIRTFEALTGVNVLIDDNADQVTLSSFDAERREVAAVALEALIADGRIHPQRIELAYAEALKGRDEGGIPIGAALVGADGTVLGTGHNRRVQDGDASAHGETDAFRNAGRQRSYRGTTMVTTLSPCWYCSGLIRQFGISRVVIGEARTFVGGHEWLAENGVEVVVVDDQRCVDLMTTFIEEHPELWFEDIGQDGPDTDTRRDQS